MLSLAMSESMGWREGCKGKRWFEEDEQIQEGELRMADQKHIETNSTFEPTDRLENFLIGLLAFIQQFLRTWLDLAFNQTGFSKAIKNRDIDKKYTRPITFITLISFIAARIFRFGALTFLLFLISFGSLSSCGTVSVTKTEYPSIADELTLPSFSEVILYGVPTLVVILLLSRLLKYVLLRGSAESTSGKTLVTITYYSVGFQYLTYLALFSITSLILYLESIDYFNSQRDFSFIAILTIPFFLFWTIFVFYRLLAKTIDKSDFRVIKRGWKQAWLVLWSVILIVATTLSEWGLVYSLAQPDIEKRLSKYLFTISLVNLVESGANTNIITLLIRNNSKEAVSLISDEVSLYGKFVHDGQIIDSCMGQNPVVILHPNEICWLRISFEKMGSDYFSLFFDPDNTIQFNSVSLDGEMKALSAYIYSDKTIFKITELE